MQTPTSHDANTATAGIPEWERHCVFRSGGSWFALPAIVIREVSGRPQLVQVPSANTAVLAGLSHVRSEFLPVISLDKLIGRSDTGATDRLQMLTLIEGNVAWGLLVHRVDGLETLDVARETVDSCTDDTWSTVIMGTARHGGRFIRVIDPKRLYRLVTTMLEGASAPNAQDELVASNPYEEPGSVVEHCHGLSAQVTTNP